MQYVTLINRSSKIVTGVWDGKRYQIPPGKNSFPETMAIKFRDQNPVRGTLDPFTLEQDHLLGIEEFNDPITPIEQNDSPELYNRKKMDPIAATAEVIQTSAGRLYAHEKSSALPLDGTFTKA